MWLDYGATNCQPDVFDKALAARKNELENVKIRSCLTMRPRAVLEEDPDGQHFYMFSWHFSGYDRKMHDAGRCHYIPLNLGEVPDYYRRFLDPVDIAILKTCPMDDGGYFNFGPANLWQRAVIERAKVVIVEVYRQVPYAFVVLRAGAQATEEEIKQFALANGPAYQHPRRVFFLPRLPLSGTNKIDKERLRDWVTHGAAPGKMI